MKTSFAASLVFSTTAILGAALDARSGTSIGVPWPSQTPVSGASRSQGCWSAKGRWKQVVGLKFVSTGKCTTSCTKLQKYVAALHAEECWCGDDYPPKGTLVSDSHCDYPCPGYNLEACGGIEDPQYFSVFNTGVKVAVENKPVEPSTTAAPGSSATAAPAPEETVIIDRPPSGQDSSSDTKSSKGGGSSAVGIAVGVVLGLLAVCGVVGGIFFYMKKKKQREEDDARQRAEAVNAFVGGGKAGSVSGSLADSRLDPVMVHRRMSDGSIADNHDYSRKILRVTNA